MKAGVAALAFTATLLAAAPGGLWLAPEPTTVKSVSYTHLTLPTILRV